MVTVKTTVQWIISGFLTLGLGGGIWGLVKYWDWLDARHVAGVIIIGLLFGAMAILGMTVQIYGELPADASSGKTIKAYFRYSAQIGGFLIILLGSMAALVILTWKLLVPLLGYGVAYVVFLVLFLTFIRLVIAVLTRLADRGAIGSPWK